MHSTTDEFVLKLIADEARAENVKDSFAPTA